LRISEFIRALNYDITPDRILADRERTSMHRLRVFVRAGVVVPLLCASAFAQSEKLNIQVSDPGNLPVSGLKITTKHPGSTETTDAAGKATLTFVPRTGLIELVIVSPKTMDFISPWQRSVTVPPGDWSIVVAPRGSRQVLENARTVAALAARANNLQARKSGDDPPPSDETRQKAIDTVAKDIGLEPKDLRARIEALTATENDPYIRAMGFLNQHAWGQASDLLSDVLKQNPNPHTSEAIEKAGNSAFFLGQALYEQGLYQKSASAYEMASQFRPEDPVILNNEGLSLSKAGDYRRANEVYQRAIEIMKNNGMAKTIDYSTTINNIAALRAYEGDFPSAEALFQESCDLRREILTPDDPRLAISLNNVAAMKIIAGDCDGAKQNLDKALKIEESQPQGPEGTFRQANAKGMVAMGNVHTKNQNHTPAAQRSIEVTGKFLATASPGPMTLFTNIAMVSVCKGDFESAHELLESLEHSQPPDKSDFGNILLNLAWVEETQRNWEEASRYYERAVVNYQNTLAPDHPQVAAALSNYGEMLLKSGDRATALAVLGDALRIDRIALGEDSQLVKDLEAKIDSLRKEQ